MDDGRGLAAILTASPLTAFAVGLVSGAVRGIGVYVTAGVSSPEQLRSLIARADRLGPASLRLCGIVGAVVAASAAFALGGAVPAALVAVPSMVLAVGRRPQRRVPVAV